jgi:BioD-like phosphotransacetylase family protein
LQLLKETADAEKSTRENANVEPAEATDVRMAAATLAGADVRLICRLTTKAPAEESAKLCRTIGDTPLALENDHAEAAAFCEIID